MADAVLSSVERPALSPYALVRRKCSGLELLRVSLESGEEVLPMFSSEDAARRFLLPGALEEWRVRWCSRGELISLLLGPCAKVKRILLDPLPKPLTTQDALANSVYRESFIASLITTEA